MYLCAKARAFCAGSGRASELGVVSQISSVPLMFSMGGVTGVKGDESSPAGDSCMWTRWFSCYCQLNIIIKQNTQTMVQFSRQIALGVKENWVIDSSYHELVTHQVFFPVKRLIYSSNFKHRKIRRLVFLLFFNKISNSIGWNAVHDRASSVFYSWLQMLSVVHQCKVV